MNLDHHIFDKQNKLTLDNFQLYAAKYYNNPYCIDVKEFKEDLQRIDNLKKLFKRLQNMISSNKEEKKVHKLIRIIVNNIIILNNTFTPHASVRMLLLKLPNYSSELKTIFVFLQCCSSKYFNIGEKDIIYIDDIPIHSVLANYLRTL